MYEVTAGKINFFTENLLKHNVHRLAVDTFIIECMLAGLRAFFAGPPALRSSYLDTLTESPNASDVWVTSYVRTKFLVVTEF